MRYMKQPASLEEQIDLLKRRGLMIDNEAEAFAVLERVSYFRLASYWRVLEEDKAQHVFKPNSHFSNVLTLRPSKYAASSATSMDNRLFVPYNSPLPPTLLHRLLASCHRPTKHLRCRPQGVVGEISHRRPRRHGLPKRLAARAALVAKVKAGCIIKSQPSKPM